MKALAGSLTCLLTGVILALAACGGGSEDSNADNGTDSVVAEADSFIADADSVCTDQAQKLTDTQTTISETPKEAAQLAEDSVAIREDALQQLQALDAPDDLADDYDEFLAKRQAVVEGQQQDLKLTKQGIPPEDPRHLKIYEKFEQLFNEGRAIGQRIGFKACASQLPADEADEARSLAVKALTEPVDSCEEVYSKYAIETSFGSLQKCEQAQTPDPPVKSVDVQDVVGVSGVSAFVNAIPKGGPDDGALIEYSFVHEGGSYKFNAAVRLPDE